MLIIIVIDQSIRSFSVFLNIKANYDLYFIIRKKLIIIVSLINHKIDNFKRLGCQNKHSPKNAMFINSII